MAVYQLLVLFALIGFVAFTAQNLRAYRRIPACIDQGSGTVAVLVPARNESGNIGECLLNLKGQDYQHLLIYVLDDQSDDDTAEIVAQAMVTDTRIILLHGQPKPDDWAGKVWACAQLGKQAVEDGAHWLLFLDADTRADSKLVSSLVCAATEYAADMTTTFPRQVTGTFWEWIAMPVLHFLITTFLPVNLVADARFPAVVAGCGQVELFTREAYLATGGHAAVRHSFHDGLQLARLTKRLKMRVFLCDASHLISCRMYRSGTEVWNGFTRNAYEGLGSTAALMTMSLLTVILFVLPVGFWLAGLALASSLLVWVCTLQVLAIATIRIMQARRFGHMLSILLHPLSMLMLVAVQWASYLRFRRGSSTEWKGRNYSSSGANNN